MKQDLSDIFRHGLATSATWTRENVREALQVLASYSPGSYVEWEPGDEEWGRVLDSDNEIVGLVCARIPIGAVRDDVPRSELPSAVTWILFKSTSEPYYQVAPEVLKEVFRREVSRNIDYGSLSLDDLWWATVI
ncbi:hypothetical protein [Sorangium cellulosum]|uniref:hypothetical protein n=1 Tax=Sorangium cellulosum TaxID=56 RepID=UPI001331244C|nr:hypothetical protein [Sorangium cellulosum]